MSDKRGFDCLRDESITELKTRARLYRHRATGAEVLSLERDDENKVFGITFKTPPYDSTGLPHILEHSVLCGSRKYPVKEPFVEILKGSLQTFLNAFTYPDKTCYPVASQNVKDFYNLIDVYLDAVFYPRITRHIFQQEGWHLELESMDGDFAYKGVVFNEMKGAYSSPERLMSEYSQHTLFPDTPYGIDSGGRPQDIPRLSYEQFIDFHRRYYHPSNARIFFYGDDDPAERLRIIGAYLDEFEARPVDADVPVQQPFDAPRRHVFACPAGESGNSKDMVTVNWLFPEISDQSTVLALAMLSHLLLGMPGSPLRKALIDSGLGEDIIGGGLEDELKQMFFSVGLKGVTAGRTEAVETLIIATLSRLVDEGIDEKTTEATVNTVEFHLRENNTGSFPRGLSLMLRSLTTWLYGKDPIEPLAFEEPLSRVKEALAADARFFESLIADYFLHNSHRTTITLVPEPDYEKTEWDREREELAHRRQRFADDQIREVLNDTRSLKEWQSTPDTPEALATIPLLTRSDLDREGKTIPCTVQEKNNATILLHDLLTNGIVYFHAGFDLRTLPSRFLPYLPLFSRAILEMGTEKEDYVTISQRIGRKTGGISPSLFSAPIDETSDMTARFFLGGKVLTSHVRDLLDIVRDCLLTVNLDNPYRFMQIVREEKARLEESIIPGGHQVINTRLHAHFSRSGWFSEQINGVSQLFFLRQLIDRIESDWPSILAVLRDIHKNLINRDALIINLTADEHDLTSCTGIVDEFIESIPSFPAVHHSWNDGTPPLHEALTAPSQINYVGKGANLYDLGYRYHGSIAVITRYLRTSWLWEKIRIQGGAYGAFCLFDRLSGVLSFLSYRDPAIGKTLANFDDTTQFLRTASFDDNEVLKGIIGTIGDIDTYMLPSAKGYVSMIRFLTGITDDKRKKSREEIFATTAEDFRAFADFLDAFKEKAVIKVLGSRDSIERAVEKEGVPSLEFVTVI